MSSSEIVTKYRYLESLLSLSNAKGGGKLKGDIFNRLVRQYLTLNLPQKKVSEPNAFIKGATTEFDLLILKNDAMPIDCLNCYEPDMVIGGVEVKVCGIFEKKENLKGAYLKYRELFDKTKTLNGFQHLQFVYLTLAEVTSPKKETSLNFWNFALDYLDPHYRCFCLSDSRSRVVREGEIERFLQEINGW